MKKSTSLSISEQNLADMDALARERQLSRSDIANEAIRLYFEARKQRNDGDREYLLGKAPWIANSKKA